MTDEILIKRLLIEANKSRDRQLKQTLEAAASRITELNNEITSIHEDAAGASI